jgi:3-deoxy-7-phosphoheptulonate synthase
VIIVMKADVAADAPDLKRVIALAESYPGISTQLHRIQGATRSVTEVYLLGPTGVVPSAPFEEFESVEKVVRVTQSFRAIGRHDGGLEAVGFLYNGVQISQDTFHVFAGLCAVDTREHVEKTFGVLKALGIVTTRAGAYKPRSSPYDFQGLGATCLPWVFELAGKYGIRIVAMEVTHEAHIGEILRALEASGRATGVMLQIGTRNAQNFELLKEVGLSNKPVMLKRGLAMTIDEWLQAAEYVAQRGNSEIILCERGIRTFEPATRNTLDLAGMAVAQYESHLPVIVDPSHAVGKRHLVAAMAKAAVAAGADAVMLDVHPNPEDALVDGAQALLPHEVVELGEQLAAIAAAVGRPMNR